MDKKKREAVQEVVFSINMSLMQFKRSIEAGFSDYDTRSPVSVNFENIAFGDNAIALFEKNPVEKQDRVIPDSDPNEVNQRINQSVIKIGNNDLGITNDDTALQLALDDLSRPEVKKTLDNGDEIAIVIEITDGESTSEANSKKILGELNGIKNVFCRAIQIEGALINESAPSFDKNGKPLPPEYIEPSGTFERIWENNGKKLADLSNLKKILLGLLIDALKEKNIQQ